jgi:hypothetical protein
LGKGLEDNLLFLRCDADAGVPNRKNQLKLITASRFHADSNPDFSLFSKLDRVADQIDDDLPQPRGVANDLIRHVRVNIAE